MKTRLLLLASATVALLTTANFGHAMAQEPKLSGGKTWATVSQHVDISSPNAAAAATRHEYQYGYDKHGA
jgi:hypothetical protein